MLLVPELDLKFQFAHLPIEFLEVLTESLQQLTEHTWQITLAVLEDARQTFGDMADSLWNDDPVLGQESADLIRLCRTRSYKPLPRTV